jgi:hypothetical protein
MISIPKVVGVLSCGVVLCLTLSNTAQAADDALGADTMKSDPCADRVNIIGQSEPMNCDRDATDTIKGEVLRIQGDNYVVQRFTGQEVRLHTDANTEIAEGLRQGDRIEARVNDVRDMNDNKRVLSIRQIEK